MLGIALGARKGHKEKQEGKIITSKLINMVKHIAKSYVQCLAQKY